jgi:branched-chain amino acid transport system substrate-binding protein
MLRHLSVRGVVIAVLAILFALIALNLVLPDSGKLKQARVGLILPLSGQASSYGELMRRGALMAQSDLSAEAPGRPTVLEVLIEDSRSAPTDGLAAFRKLVDVDHSIAVLPALSSVVTALLPYAQKEKVLLLNCAATTPKIRKAGDFIFSTMPLSDQEARVAANYVIKNLKAHRIAVIYLNDASGQGFYENFQDALISSDARVVLSEGHPLGTTDFHLVAQRILSSDAEVVYLPTYAAEAGLFVRQLRQAGGKMPLLSYSAIEDPKFLQLAGEAAEGVMYTRPVEVAVESESLKSFSSRYEAKFGSKPDVWTTQYYDCIRLIAKALDEGAHTSQELVRKLEAGFYHEGLKGTIKFDSDGIVVKNIEFRQIKSGSFIPVSTTRND